MYCSKAVGLLIAITIFQPATTYRANNAYVWLCQGGEMDVTRTDCSSGILQIESITIFSSTNVSAIERLGSGCVLSDTHYQCERRITKVDDGLSEDYKYLYNWIASKCEGRPICEQFKAKEWWDLVGIASNDVPAARQRGVTCPKDVMTYFAGIYMDFGCFVDEDAIPTVGAPPSTTPRPRPTTPSTTTPFPVIFFVYLPGLEPREKIILGVVIGLAVVILLVLLLILYCWDRWRRHRKFNKLLRLLGRPQVREDEFDELENYGKADAWRDETDNVDALGEYTGVKPDEVLTIDRNHMEKAGMIYSNHMGTLTTMGRNNTASTLSKRQGPHFLPDVKSGTGYIGPVDYDTDANLELERRMAAALHGSNDGSDVEDTSRH